jgi:PAS domain S-box-containing protein
MNQLPASPSGDSIDAQVQRNLALAFRTRLRQDSRLVLLGHMALLVLLAVSLSDDGLGVPLVWWLGAAGLVTAARAIWQRAADSPAITESNLFLGTRTLVLLQALTWGAGAALLLPPIVTPSLAIVLIGFAGIGASATSTLVADRVSMRCVVAGMYGPVLFGLLFGARDWSDIVSATIFAMFALVLLLLARRGNLALIETLRTTVLLTHSHQETARESAYLSSLLHNAPTAIAVLDDSRRVRMVNSQFVNLFGFPAEELLGHPLDDLLIPDSGREEFGRRQTLLQQGESIYGEVQRRTKSGDLILVQMRAAPVLDPTAPGTVVLYEDITQRRQAQKTLREREARLSRLVDSNLLGIGFWDVSGVISEANDEYLRIIGYTREDLLAGQVNFRTFSPPEYAAINNLAQEKMAQGLTVTPWEAEVIRKDGRRVPILVGVACLDDLRDRGVAFFLDITDRRQAEAQVRYKTAMLEAQVNTSIDGILVVDTQGKAILTNKRMAELWGIPQAIAEDEDDSRRLQFVVQQTKHPEAFLERVQYLYAHPTENSKDEIELSSGLVLDRYSAPVIGANGEHYGRIWSFRDVTDWKLAEQALRNARDLAERAAETRSMFLANMSHEIRTPMNAVLGMIEIVLDTELTTEQRYSLGLASSSAESLLGTLNDVLDFSKIEAGRLEVEAIPFDLQRLVQSTASLLALRAAQKGLELIADMAPTIPGMVRGDPSRLRQILTNLVGNSIKFTERGEIIITVRPEPTADGRPGVLFSVRDTGVGIAADKLGDIFKEFIQADGSTSRRFGGTGLGLTISQRLAGLMGGRITVTSEVGRGSEFTFTLPLVAEPAAVPTAAAKPASLAGRSILVVDDRAINRRIFGEMLTAEGARVVEAEDVASGLTLLRAARDAGKAPALAIVDAQMPGHDGYTLASQVKGDPSLADTPLLMLTSTGRRGDAARCRDLGVAAYLTKPVSRTDLLETVSAILGGRGEWGLTGSIITRHSLAEAREPLRILLADDNPVNQEVAATMLRKRGHRVDLAGNGLEAVAAVQREHYDLVLMDIQMPEMDGLKATAAIRALAEGGELPIIALTAHAFAAERDRCVAAGMNGFLSKPFRAHELFAAVESRGTSSPAPASQQTPTVHTLGTAVVDLEVLRSHLRDAGAEAALDGIVDTFLDSVPDRLKTLRDALVLGTPTEVATAAHALKSSAGTIGAAPLAALLAEIEAAGWADKLFEKGLLADRVDDAAAAVLTDLKAYRNEAA